MPVIRKRIGAVLRHTNAGNYCRYRGKTRLPRFMLTPETDNAITAHAIHEGLSRSDLLEEVLRAYFKSHLLPKEEQNDPLV